MCALHVNLRVLHEPLGVEYVGVRPHLGVSLDGVCVYKQLCAARQVVAPYLGGFDGLVGDGHWGWGVQSKDLLHHCLCVGQVLNVGLGDGAFLTHHAVNLGLHSLHYVWVADELGNAPLHSVGGGVGAGEKHVL